MRGGRQLTIGYIRQCIYLAGALWQVEEEGRRRLFFCAVCFLFIYSQQGKKYLVVLVISIAKQNQTEPNPNPSHPPTVFCLPSTPNHNNYHGNGWYDSDSSVRR